MSGEESYAPIERSSVAEQVAQKILDMVRTKILRPGDLLPTERDLATLLQVSRPSVREAVRGLQILGVLKVRHGSGITVSALEASDLLGPLQYLITLDARNLDTLYEARVLVDGGIASLAAQRISDQALTRLQQRVEQQRDLVMDPVAFRASDLEFHRIIMEAAGNPFLLKTSLSFYELGLEYRRISSETPGVLKQSVADHQAIVAALVARDPKAAAAAASAHMNRVHQSTVEAMEQAL